MALDKTTLAATISATLTALKDYDGSTGKTQADAIDKLSGDLADAIDVFVKSGTVSTTVASGITVQVDPVTGIGATTGTGAGTGSVT